MIIKELTNKAICVLNNLLDNGFIINSYTERGEVILQKESIQIELTDLNIYNGVIQ